MSRASPRSPLSHTTRKLINTNRLYYHSSSRGNRMRRVNLFTLHRKDSKFRFGFVCIVRNYLSPVRWMLMLSVSKELAIFNLAEAGWILWNVIVSWKKNTSTGLAMNKVTPLLPTQTLPFVTVTLSASSILEVEPPRQRGHFNFNFCGRAPKRLRVNKLNSTNKHWFTMCPVRLPSILVSCTIE